MSETLKTGWLVYFSHLCNFCNAQLEDLYCDWPVFISRKRKHVSVTNSFIILRCHAHFRVNKPEKCRREFIDVVLETLASSNSNVNTFCYSRVWKLFESLLNFRIMLESKIATRKLSENRSAKDIHCCMYSVKINLQPQRQNCRNRKWSLLPLTESRVIINVSMTDVVFLGFRFIFPVCKLHSIRCIDVKLTH